MADGETAGSGGRESRRKLEGEVSALRRFLLRASRIPHLPEPPPGDPAQLRVFRAGRNYLRYKTVGWSLAQLAAFVPLVLSTVGVGVVLFPWMDVTGGLAEVDEAMESVSLVWLTVPVFLLTWGIFVLQAVLSFVAVRLDYELRWYMLSDRALRIRHGVFTVREQTMTYANIQQISVRRGPLQRLLGLGDVEVRTAGGGGAKGGGGHDNAQAAKRDLHRGFFKGVEDPETIRDTIRARVDAFREAGLGDPDEHRVRPGTRVPAALAAARELHVEVSGLREDLTGGPGF